MENLSEPLIHFPTFVAAAKKYGLISIPDRCRSLDAVLQLRPGTGSAPVVAKGAEQSGDINRMIRNFSYKGGLMKDPGPISRLYRCFAFERVGSGGRLDPISVGRNRVWEEIVELV